MREIIYSKFSNERNRRFAIRTDILEENGNRLVKKTALYPEGKKHEENMVRWYDELKKSYSVIPYEANKCTKEEEGVCLEYVEGKTLEEYLDELILSGKKQEAEHALKEYLKNVEKICSGQEFIQTEAFEEVFGKVAFENKLLCTSVTNIDMVCGNLILTTVPVVLDYEWTFDFPIPAKYVLYRIIHYYIDTNVNRSVLDDTKIYEEFGITEKLKEQFLAMERSFQQYITGAHVPMRNMYAKMTPGVSSSQDSFKYLQIFFGENGIYSEKKSVRLPANDGNANFTVPIPEGCDRLRLDPGDSPCIVKIDRLSFGEKAVNLSETVIPEGCVSGNWVYIGKNDPNISDIAVPKAERELIVSMQIFGGKEEMIKGMVQQNLAVNEKITRQASLIKEMEGTKVWKVYQAYRKRVERKS